MAKLLYKLSGVPDDEVEEIRQMLEKNEFDYYETSSGLLGLSFAGIWLKQDEQFDDAKKALDDYHQQRYRSAQEKRELEKRNGENLTLWESFKLSPIRTTLAALFVIAVMYLAISPFYPL